MEIRTVDDLQLLLQKNNYSPENLAREVKISSMTLRRLLKRPGHSLIPDKYQASLNLYARFSDLSKDKHTEGLPEKIASLITLPTSTFEGLLTELEESGQKCQDLDKLEKDTSQKLLDRNVGRDLTAQVRTVLAYVFGKEISFRVRALSIGALLYFINPFDLIPDSIPVVGYLDDFAVLTLVIATAVKWQNKEEAVKPDPVHRSF